MTVQTLSLAVSSPPSAGKKTVGLRRDSSISMPGLVLPIELENNCSEEGVVIESDDVILTNAIRKHFLEHFGHRDLNGIVSEYTKDAILIIQEEDAEGSRTKYHGHPEIRAYFEHVFDMHPVGDSSFQMERITVEQKHGTCVWSAKTPSLVVSEGSDTFVFNAQGKIVKQFFTCQSHPRENPGTSRVLRRDSKECGGFFK